MEGIAGLLCSCGIPLLFFAVIVAGMWKVFEKAGQPGWAAIVPIYNMYVLVVEIAKKDMVWFLLSIFVPFAAIIPMMDVAEKFGKDRMYGLGLYFLGFIFFPMLGFSDARYQGSRGRAMDLDDEEEEPRPRKKKRPVDDDEE
jgi:hypothetical protein